MIGEGILLECLQDERVHEILSVSRKPSGKSHPKLSEYIVTEFLDLPENDSKLQGYDACFFCAGVSSVGMEKPLYEKLTYDTTMTFAKALGNKLGIERYGFCLPMDDCLAQVAIDFGGRNWLVWEAEFKREMIGQMPTEMFFHFFKSFTDGAKANLNIKAEGTNEHHKIEAIFKAFAKAIKVAVKRDTEKMILPSTKGML